MCLPGRRQGVNCSCRVDATAASYRTDTLALYMPRALRCAFGKAAAMQSPVFADVALTWLGVLHSAHWHPLGKPYA
jgi:hypothetical protein